MKPEFLFRGKRLDNGEWGEGFYFEKTSPIFPKRKTHFILYQQKDNYGFPGPMVISQEVDPNTVGRYTGLTDKNGVRIFEGDILAHGGTVYIVDWFDERAGFILRYGTNKFWVTSFTIVEPENCTAIGNIHDNPELLKGGAV